MPRFTPLQGRGARWIFPSCVRYFNDKKVGFVTGSVIFVVWTRQTTSAVETEWGYLNAKFSGVKLDLIGRKHALSSVLSDVLHFKTGTSYAQLLSDFPVSLPFCYRLYRRMLSFCIFVLNSFTSPCRPLPISSQRDPPTIKLDLHKVRMWLFLSFCSPFGWMRWNSLWETTIYWVIPTLLKLYIQPHRDKRTLWCTASAVTQTMLMFCVENILKFVGWLKFSGGNIVIK
jgi:hypothetical protein